MMIADSKIEGCIKIVNKSLLSGKANEMDLPITIDQVQMYLEGTHIQNAFSNLNAGQREFILTGITPEEWDNAFPEEEEDGDIIEAA